MAKGRSNTAIALADGHVEPSLAAEGAPLAAAVPVQLVGAAVLPVAWDDKAGPSKQVAASESAEGVVFELPAMPLPHRPLQMAIKRAFDVAFSLACLILGAPLLLAIVAAVKLDSEGPALYRQVRVGRNGKPFYIIKFRSMVTDAERNGPRWARSQDTRVTRVGGILRRTSLDELPQIWNVLLGEMSWIGPRPERPVFVSRFRLQIEGYDARHLMRPGLSGWAQVNGMRGNVSIESRTSFDVHYVRHFSVWLDIVCFFRTFSVLAGE